MYEITLRMVIQNNILLKEETCVYFIGRSKGVTPESNIHSCNFCEILTQILALFSVGVPRLGNPGFVTVFDKYKHNVTWFI